KGSYTFATVDVPGATSTFLTAINNKGQIVGSQRDGNAVRHSVLIESQTFSTFDPPGFSNTAFPGISEAVGINDTGEIVGDVLNNGNAGLQAYSVQHGTFSLFTHPDADASRGTSYTAVNNAGERVGGFNDKDDVSHGFIQTGGTTTRLEDVAKMPANT